MKRKDGKKRNGFQHANIYGAGIDNYRQASSDRQLRLLRVYSVFYSGAWFFFCFVYRLAVVLLSYFLTKDTVTTVGFIFRTFRYIVLVTHITRITISMQTGISDTTHRYGQYRIPRGKYRESARRYVYRLQRRPFMILFSLRVTKKTVLQRLNF